MLFLSDKTEVVTAANHKVNVNAMDHAVVIAFHSDTDLYGRTVDSQLLQKVKGCLGLGKIKPNDGQETDVDSILKGTKVKHCLKSHS